MSSLNILVVEDDSDFAHGLAEVLETGGHQVVLTYSGEEAMDRFEEADFDLVFLDIKLPGISGLESFFDMRRRKPGARVFMMTGYRMEQLLEQAVEDGKVGIVYKPARMEEVIAALEHVVPNGIVLAAHDDPDAAQFIRRSLLANGYEAVIVRSGTEGFEETNSDQVDVLIIDLRSTILNAVELYLELKMRGTVVPTIIVTGHAKQDVEMIDILKSLSVSGCLFKPFDPGALLRELGNLQWERISLGRGAET